MTFTSQIQRFSSSELLRAWDAVSGTEVDHPCPVKFDNEIV